MPPLQKSLRLRRFKSDRDEIWQECSSNKYASIDGVGSLMWRRNFKLAAMRLFYAKCSRLPSDRRLCSNVRQFLIYSAFLVTTQTIWHDCFWKYCFLICNERNPRFKMSSFLSSPIWRSVIFCPFGKSQKMSTPTYWFRVQRPMEAPKISIPTQTVLPLLRPSVTQNTSPRMRVIIPGKLLEVRRLE